MAKYWTILLSESEGFVVVNPSKDTIPTHGLKVLTPEFLLLKLPHHPLTRQLYPVAMGRYQRAAGHQMERKNHRHHLLIYCTEGQGRVRFYGHSGAAQEQLVVPGTLLLLPPGVNHAYAADPSSPWSIYWVHYEGELAANFTERLQMKMPDGLANIGHQPRVIADFETLLELPERGYTATNVIHAVHLLQQLLSFLALQLRLHQAPGSAELDIEVLEALMMERLHSTLNLDTLAARANLSKYYFSKKFKELTECSPIQYFINMKMQHASYLLEHRAHSVKQIAASLGYEDAYYFSRLFKKIIGQSPAQYRKDEYRKGKQ